MENRAAVLLAMVQALSVKYGSDCLGTESERRRLASMGPEERFKALQIEFVALTYRLETREMELRATRTKLSEVEGECTALKKLHSVESRQSLEESIIAKHAQTHATEMLEMHTALEHNRQKLKASINADLQQHLPKQKAATLDDILLAAGLKPKDTSTRSRLHALLGEHREKHKFYPIDEEEAMVLKLKTFASENERLFDRVKPASAMQPTLPWEPSVGGKRKHPVDKVWDSALEHVHRK
jgi:hypothetical protein